MAASDKYIKFGLRRDKNLSDVNDPTASLNNLLNNLVNDPSGSFTSEDLDAIRGLRNSDMTPAILNTLAGATVKTSQISSNNTVVLTDVRPLITLKDRIDTLKIYTGEVPAYAGGQGLPAVFVSSNRINTGTASSTGSSIFNTSGLVPEIFWEAGQFSFGSVIDRSFSNRYGGVQWQGYFSPSLGYPTAVISFTTTGLIIIEYDLFDDGNWVTVCNAYAATRTGEVISQVDDTHITLSPESFKHVFVGDIVGSNPAGTITVTEYNKVTNIITVSAAYAAASGSLQFTKVLGTTKTSSTAEFPIIEFGTQIKIRISVWFPNTGQQVTEKQVLFSYIGTTMSSGNLYATRPTTQGQYGIKTFLSNVTQPAQPKIGASGAYKNLYVEKAFVSLYTPKSSFAEIVKTSDTSAVFTAARNILAITPGLSNIGIGDFVVPVSYTPSSIVPRALQVKSILTGAAIVMTEYFTTSGTETVRFINHLGFKNWCNITLTTSDAVLHVNSIAKLRVGNILITNATTAYDFIHIIGIDSINNTVTVNVPVAVTLNDIVYFYSDKGLLDTSKDIFCIGVFGRKLAASVQSGNSITLTDINGVQIGQHIQYDGPIAQGTTITGISGNTVTMSANVTSLIVEQSTITFAPIGTTLNKEGCNLPADTAPPFVGTAAGLTTAGRGIKSNASVSTFTVNVDQISATIPSNLVSSAVITESYTRKILINTSSGPGFSVLGTTA